MYWVRFSSLLTYTTIFVINVIQLIITYDLFIIAGHYNFLFENDNVITVYHRNNSNIYWFLFSSFISFMLFGFSLFYYTYYYTTAFIKFARKNPREFYYFIFDDDLFTYDIYDFFSLSANTAWSIVWSIHILLDIILRSLNINETGKLFILLSTQITLISLRYPLLFQRIGEASSEILRNDDIIESIKIKKEVVQPKHEFDLELKSLIG